MCLFQTGSGKDKKRTGREIIDITKKWLSDLYKIYKKEKEKWFGYTKYTKNNNKILWQKSVKLF